MSTPYFYTADLCDAHAARLHVLAPGFTAFTGQSHMMGPVETLSCHNDNGLIKQVLDEPGQGRILVIDGQASLNHALIGGNLGLKAQERGWAGLVIDGAVRDRHELATLSIAILALGSSPLKSAQSGAGERGQPISIRNTVIRRGMWLYSDQDGLVISAQPLHTGSA
ncbi:ribonuclease E activity regulator RraA [Woodsholea maritima]|uniref:ribonuclease E activity regulator RraA n=1 Tax=Woodsholea maritima TaxID=240237 RepID=UPI00036266AB|nr:ribonuclease E activity regulator RraA [Woodsholea maritima]